MGLRSVGAMLLVLALPGTAAWANESAREDRPASESVKEAEGPLRRGLAELEAPETVFPGLRNRLKDLPPFVRDMDLVLALRTMSLQVDDPDPSFPEVSDPRDLALDPQAWALGGALTYRSGLLWETVSVGTTFFTAQPLRTDDPFGRTDVLHPATRATPRSASCGRGPSATATA